VARTSYAAPARTNYTAPAKTSYPVPAKTSYPMPGNAKNKKSGSGLLAVLVFIVIVLISTGIGRQLWDAISNLISQWTR
jgi:hypothetical protein